MKAIFFEQTGAIEHIRCGELASLKKVPPQENEILIRFRAGSLNHLDLWVLRGLPSVKYTFPHIVGSDFCGEVVESKSSKFKVGDRVLVYPATSSGKKKNGKPTPENLCEDFRIRGENAPGIFCEQITISDRFVFHAPEHLNDSEAAAVPLVFVTAWQMVAEKAGINPETGPNQEPLLVHGAGSGVTQAILELLLSFGEKKIALTSRHASKLEAWKKRGITTFILNETAKDEIKAWAGEERISCIFDHVGQSLFEMNIRLLKIGGKFITCGATSGYEVPLDLRHLFFRQLQLLGSTMGSLPAFAKMLDWIKQKKLRPKIFQEFPWEKVASAFKVMDTASQDGKIVLLNTQKPS